MITVNIEITRTTGPAIAPHQVEKFVEESLHQFQTALQSFLETRTSNVRFCEALRGKGGFQLVRHAGIDERFAYPDGTFGLVGYNGHEVDCSPPPIRKNRTQ